ncbi:MAG: J domain-containing protein, partial [Gordonibacter urolithinfaciens]
AGWPLPGGQGTPFGQGQGTRPAPGRTPYVWTSWDGIRTAGGDPGVGGPFDPFDPFAPFRAAEPRKTPQQVLAEAVRSLRSEALAVAGKAAVLAVAALLGSVATGLFFYVMISLVWSLWKRLGSCLIGFIVPIALLGAPFVFLIAPRQGAVTVGLAVFFLAAVLFDAVNLRNALRAYRAAKRAARP